jgi:hypothetical protein
MVQNQLGLVFLFKRLLSNLVGRFNQLPQHRLTTNDLRVVFDIG